MRKAKSVIWLILFVGLLLINVTLVVTGNISPHPEDDENLSDGPFLAATDEVQLEWWPENIIPEAAPAPSVSNLAKSHLKASNIIGVRENGMDVEEYPELMTYYIGSLNEYLNAYFNIAPYKMETSEE